MKKLSKKYSHKRMIDLLQKVCSDSSIKPELQCINIVQLDGNIQKVTATDAFRLHQIDGLRTGFDPGVYNLKELQKYDGNYPDTSILKHPEDIYFEGSIEDFITDLHSKGDLVYIKDYAFKKIYIEDALHFINEMNHIIHQNIKVSYDKDYNVLPLKISIGNSECGAFALIMPLKS